MTVPGKVVEGGRPMIHERLRRLLFLVPYVAKNPGIRVDQLAAALGLTREDLLEDLDLLTLVGRPPFQPDDFLDIYVDHDKVYVDLDVRLSAPPRLTAAEAAALAAAAELLRAASSEALTSALHKLERVIPPGAAARYREIGDKLDLQLDSPGELAPLARAIVEHREVEFDYFAAGKGETEGRVVRPEEIFSHRGQWYLSAWDVQRGDERLFRVDRMAGARVTERKFTPRASAGRGRAVPNPVKGAGSAAAKPDVLVRFTPEAAPYLQERFGGDARPVEGGGLEVRVAGDSERWLTQWVLSFGGDAEVIEPEWARQAVARAAEAPIKS